MFQAVTAITARGHRPSTDSNEGGSGSPGGIAIVSRTVFDLQSELTTRQSELGATLDELQRTFAQVPRVGNVDGCTHCWTADNLRALGGDPAWVPDDIVVLFAQEVPSHWVREQYGSLWRTFAGRILRLVAAHPDHYLDQLHGARAGQP